MYDALVLLNAKFMVPARVDRIHLHWTAGPAQSRPDEADHYHAILNQDLTVSKGRYTAKDNENTLDNIYAAHTKSANRFAYGYSLAGMRGAKEKPFNPGPDPITEKQWSRAMIHLAQLCKFYHVAPTDKKVLTHAEVQSNLGIKQNGKWDITVLPWQADKWNTAKKVGDLMRAEIQHILEKGLV